MSNENYSFITSQFTNLESLELDEYILANFQRILDMDIIPVYSCQGHHEHDKAYLSFVATDEVKQKLFDYLKALAALTEDYLPTLNISYLEMTCDGVMTSVPAVSIFWFPCGAYKEALDDILTALESVR